jgi:DNA-binding transcriptional MerR regulator
MRQRKQHSQPIDMQWVLTGSQPGAEAADRRSYTIGDLAHEFGTTLRTLRFYEQKGLLSPRHDGTLRVYSDEDRARLALVLKGKRLGFTLGEIAEMLAARDGGEGRSLDLSRQKCIDQIKLLERQKRDIEQAIAELRQIYSSFYVGSPKLASDS